MAFAGFKDKISQATTKVTETTSNLKDQGSDMAQKAFEASMQELKELRPLLKESGFIIGDVIVTASIPPKFSLVIEQKEAGLENLSTVIDEKELSKFQSTVLTSISKVYALEEVVNKHEHTIGQIEIEMGIPPSIKAHLNSNHSRAFG